MNYYYVNDKAQTNGDHEVHQDGCQFMPKSKSYLGYFSGCHEALLEANKKYPGRADGCAYCCPACHKR